MTAPEQARFLQRRCNDLYAFAFNFLVFGPVLFAIPGLLLALLVAACVWGLSLVFGDRMWAVLIPALIVVGCLAGLVFLGSYLRMLRQCLDRCKLPRDAVLRVLTIDREQLQRCKVSFLKPTRLDGRSTPLIKLILPDIGEAELVLDDPEEGELRISTDGAIRIGWSPLRRYFVEWIEVPASWPIDLDQAKAGLSSDRISLTSVPHLEDMYGRVMQ